MKLFNDKYYEKFNKIKSIQFLEYMKQNEKWTISFALGLLFLIFSSKFVYIYINMFTLYFNKNIFTNIGCIKTAGLFISAILFTLALYIIFTLYAEDTSYNDNILVISILIGTIFFILNLNIFYFFVENIREKLLFKNKNTYSCEKTIFSKLILFLLFVLIVRFLLSF